MARPYQESFGDDYYEDGPPFTRGYRENDDDLPSDWYYGAPGEERPRPVDTIGFNPKTKQWECTCKQFQAKGTCSHSYRFKKQVNVIPKEEYL